MNVSSAIFNVPITFPALSNLSSSELSTSDLTEQSSCGAECSSIISWGFSRDTNPVGTVENNQGGDSTKGVVIGCVDGSLYAFKAQESLPAPSPPHSLPTSPVLRENAVRMPSSQPLTLYLHAVPVPSPSRIAVLSHVTGSIIAVLYEAGNIVLTSLLDGQVVASTHVDAVSIRPPEGICETLSNASQWLWSNLQILCTPTTTLLIATASCSIARSLSVLVSGPLHESNDNPLAPQTRIAIFEANIPLLDSLNLAVLDKAADWQVNGPAQSVNVLRSTSDPPEMLTLLYLTLEAHLFTRQLRLLPYSAADAPPSPIEFDNHSSNILSIPLLKALTGRPNNHLSVKTDTRPTGRLECESDLEYDVGALCEADASLIGMSVRMGEDGLVRGIAWGPGKRIGFTYQKQSLVVQFTTIVKYDIERVEWVTDNHYVVVGPENINRFNFQIDSQRTDAKAVNRKSDAQDNPEDFYMEFCIDSFHPSPDEKIHCAGISTTILTSQIFGKRTLRTRLFYPDHGQPDFANLWIARHDFPTETFRLTVALPNEEAVFLGYSNGSVHRGALADLTTSRAGGPTLQSAVGSLDVSICALKVVRNVRNGSRVLVGGGDDGSIVFWDMSTLKMVSRWTVFVSPLSKVLEVGDLPSVRALRGCILCVSEDGSIAVIAIDGLQFLFLVPGSSTALTHIALNSSNLMLLYSDGHVRLWDVDVREFWRATSAEKASELISQGGWSEWAVNELDGGIESRGTWRAHPSAGLDTVSSFVLDLERLVSDATTALKTGTGFGNGGAISALRGVLSVLLTPGLNEDIDRICYEQLGLSSTQATAGVSLSGGTVLYTQNSAIDNWSVSSDVSAARAIAIVAVLRVFTLVEEFADPAGTVLAFYATSLISVVGKTYRPPSLVFLARRWFDASNELRQASRMLFDAAVPRLTDENTVTLAEKWQHYLPCLQPPAECELSPAALSLFLCGFIAAEHYSLLSTSTLTDISKSISLYLHDENSSHRVIAVELSARGFHVWQHYTDAMEIIRALCSLATSSRKESISTQNLAPQARLAVLHIVGTDTPLFMTTLGLDILNPRSVEHRKSVLQIVAFLIRKRPLVLYPNLPKLMEAVVKSLDPNSTVNREAVLDTATEILVHVVKTFPTIDFHSASQRLAVGTSEGAIVMYDLKTAIRLYVLEGHNKRIAACSFSPDGRRLVTVSLEESVVRVWKVGTSFSSFFNPGAPPRQGHGGSEPFKTLAFNVGDEGDMTVAATLDWVHFEWPAERSVRLKIKESVLTFST